jgi:hypothetical protein
MKALANEAKVISLANTLKVDPTDAVGSIRDFCAQRVRRVLQSRRSVGDIRGLQELVCERLNLVVYEIWSEADLDNVVARYAPQGELGFAYLPTDLDSETYGVLFRLNKPVGKRFAWVAVVDCRGEKRHRRFFTLWHEIVHCITASELEQYALPFRRTIIAKNLTDPIERLTDLVAGDLGFYDPLFLPHLERELTLSGRLTFDGVQRVRDSYCPDASFEATLNACVTRASIALLLIKAGSILKNAEQAAVDSAQQSLFKVPAPQPKLRVISTVRNNAARASSLHIPRHFRVPQSSIIAKAFSSPVGTVIDGASEPLELWTCSNGHALARRAIDVHARRTMDAVVALVTPTKVP